MSENTTTNTNKQKDVPGLPLPQRPRQSFRLGEYSLVYPKQLGLRQAYANFVKLMQAYLETNPDTP